METFLKIVPEADVISERLRGGMVWQAQAGASFVPVFSLQHEHHSPSGQIASSFAFIMLGSRYIRSFTQP